MARPSTLCNVLLLASAVLMTAMPHGPARSDSVKPFDPITCFCFGWHLLDLSIGHFVTVDGEQRFEVDEGLTNGPDGKRRPQGDLIDPRLNYPDLTQGPYLGYDAVGDQSRWCFLPLTTEDKSEPQLASTACWRTSFPSWTVPDDCGHLVSIDAIANYARALEGATRCESLAPILGLEPQDAEGCAGGGLLPSLSLGFICLMYRWERMAKSGSAYPRKRRLWSVLAPREHGNC